MQERRMDQAARPFESVTVFGGATLDRVARSSAAPVMGASNPGTVRHLPGGVGFNVATVLARLGVPTRMATAVGNDAAGEAIVNAARVAGIDTSGMRAIDGATTAGYHATLDDRGNLIIGIADMKICERITPAAVVETVSKARPRDFWVVDANLPEATLHFLAQEAANAKRPIAGLTVSPAKAVRLIPILDDLTYVFTNRKEASALLDRDPDSDTSSPLGLATELAGPRQTSIIVTNGSDPLAAATDGDVRSFAPLKANARGVNGAGDSLVAGTILGLSEGLGLADALRFGLAAAAMAVEAGSIISAPFSADALAERIVGAPESLAS
jgi:sugar/nucleoside kinase (ribokinase family)